MGALRQTAALASSRAIVLECVKRYFAQVGRAPSRREIRGGTGLSLRQVQAAVHALADEGELLVHPGHHGITLPDAADKLSEGDVLLILQRRGWMINLSAARAGDPPTA